jgi:hypothetical protein
MDVQDDRMPEAEVQAAAMSALLNLDPEAWASMRGLMAMLALPLVHSRDGKEHRRIVEVEVSPNVWRGVDQISVTVDDVVVSAGLNGHRQEWRFPIARGVPRWRMPPTNREEPNFIAATGAA